MKRKFTFLTAALALLACLAIPLGMRGQAPVGTTLWAEDFSGFANNADPSGEYTANSHTGTTVYGGVTITYSKTNGGGTTQTYTSGGPNSNNNLLIAKNNGSFTISGISTGEATELTVNYAKSGSGTIAISTSTTDVTIDGSASGSTITTNGASTLAITFTNTSSGSNLRIDDIGITVKTAGSGGGQATTYTVTFDAGDGTFVGNTDFPSTSNTVAAGTYPLPSAERTGYTFNGWLPTGGTTPLTGSYTVSGDVDFTAQYTQNVTPTPGGDFVIDFESVASSYTDWTFTNMNSQQTHDGVSAHGGDYFGKTGGTQTASIVTAQKVATPNTLTCYVSKVTNNTTSSTWYIQVSSDGTTWTDVESRSATDMAKGEWKEFAADLSQYSDVYVRVYYSGSTAVRAIDDLTLTTTVSTVATPVFSPADGTEFGNEGLNVTITCGTTGANIYYTLDGSTPDNQSTPYNEPISLTATTTIKAIAHDGSNYSNVATATYTYVDPNAPGTEHNPYTVAQAIANTPSNGNVYIQGIVSSFYNTSIVGDGSNYRYYISDDGTTTTQLLVYKGSGLNQVAFANANDLLVGDEVVIYGSLITYQSAPEVASGNYLYSWNRPAAAVEAPTFSPVAGTYAIAQTVTLTTATSGADIYYTLDGTDPDMNSTMYENPIEVNETTTIKAVAYDGDDTPSTIATATYHINSQDNPYTVTQALAFNEYPANGIYVSGIVSTAPTQSPTSNGELTYYISVDGNATDQLEVYKGKGLNQAAFTAQGDIQVGDIVTIYGNVVVYTPSNGNPVIEFASGNYLVSFERPTTPTPTHTLTFSVDLPGAGTVSVNEGAIENGASIAEGTVLDIAVTVVAGYTFLNWTTTSGTIAEATNPNTTFTMGNDDAILTAHFTQQQTTYTVTFDPGDGIFYGSTNFPNLSNTVPAGTYTLPSATKAGYTFNGWAMGATTLAGGASYEVTGNADFVASYTQNTSGAGVTDCLDNASTGISGTSYESWTATGSSGAEYAGQSAGGTNTSGSCIQIRSSNSNSGIVTTTSGGKALKVSVEWNDATQNERTLNIYGSNTAYTNPTELYGNNLVGELIGTIVKGTSTELSITGDFAYIGICSASGAIYLNEICIEWESAVTGPTITVAPATIAAPAAGKEETLTLTLANITISDIDNLDADFCNADGTAISGTKPDWVEFEFNTVTGGGYELKCTVVENTETSDRTAYFHVYGLDDDGTTETYSNVVTVNQEAYVATLTALYTYSINGEEDPTTYEAVVGVPETLVPVDNLNDDFTFAGWTLDPDDVENIITGTEYTFPAEDAYTLYAVYQHTIAYGVTRTSKDGASYVKVTSTSDITDGNYLIVYEDGAVAFDGSRDKTNTPKLDDTNNTIDVFDYLENETITSNATTNAAIFEIAAIDGGYSIQSASGYYIGQTSDANGMAVDNQTVYSNSISFTTDGDATIVSGGAYLRFNSASNQLRFRYYKSSSYEGQKAIQLYKYTAGGTPTPQPVTAYYTRVFNETATANITITGPSIIPSGSTLNMGTNTLTNTKGAAKLLIEDGGKLVASNNVDGTMLKSVTGFGNDNTPSNYYLISAPFTTNVDPIGLQHMVSSSYYDLYYFDQNPPQETGDYGLEWRNYKSRPFDLEPGIGYLYANKETCNVEFADNLRASYDANNDQYATYEQDIENLGEQTFAGWNLVGNPFTSNASVNKAFFKMNASKNGIHAVIVPINGVIAPMEGVFVKTENATDVVTFTATTDPVTALSNSKRSISLNVNRDNELLDRAIVNVNAEGSLCKLCLSDNVTKIYFAQNAKEYALVSTGAQGEMPVSFKAAENGTYTISVDAENMEMNYLHLIDNMTGADVDLLATPSYTFEARTNDYTSRFRLVFSASNSTSENETETFAYYNGSEWVISNMGEATLQVIDVMGRVLSSETVNGFVNVSLNQTPGVYMLRLINGNSVKTQKIVVK